MDLEYEKSLKTIEKDEAILGTLEMENDEIQTTNRNLDAEIEVEMTKLRQGEEELDKLRVTNCCLGMVLDHNCSRPLSM